MRIGPRWLALLAASLAVTNGTHGELADVARLVPENVLAAYMVDFPPPTPEAPKSSNSFDIATVVIDQASALGVLNSIDISLRGWLDAIAAMSPILAHSHAVMLFDLQVSHADEDTHRVSKIGAAVVLRTRGENRQLEKRIQHLLGSYTNQSESQLDTFDLNGHRIHRLRDQRLEDWCVLSWAAIGENFVVALGEQSMAAAVAVLDSPSESLWHDRTFRSGVQAIAADNALITVHLAFDEVSRRSKLLGAKVSKMQSPLKLDGCRRGLWAAGYSGKSLEIRQWLLRDRGESTAVIAGREFLDDASQTVLPADARTFAAIGVQPSVWFERFRDAYLAARSAKNGAESRSYWREVERDAGLQFVEFFARLGGPILVHDFPLHGLRLPPAWTIVVPIRQQASAVREQVNAIMSYWRSQLEGGSLQLAQTDDGIWFMKVGLEGPAVVVTDQQLLISFSPQAVRQNLALAKARP